MRAHHELPVAIKERIHDEEPDLDWFNRPRNPLNPDPNGIDQSQTWQAPEIQLGDGRPIAPYRALSYCAKFLLVF